jgi:methylenetetrahydrofolate dehydrogenase (NADP+)/methenyltetrahydrofolate cyclohydrolase
MSKIIYGKKIAEEFVDEIRNRVSDIKSRGIYPQIALINASSDPASKIYVSKKKKLADFVGIKSCVYEFDECVKETDLSNLITKLNQDISVNSILLQSPLSNGIVFRNVVNLIDPDKDVDGLTTLNQGRLFSGEPGVVPCTPLGIMHLLKTVHTELAGLHAVILGRSSIVGRPLSQLLLNSNCTVTLLHSYSKNLPEICRTADILVSAIGNPCFVDKSFVKPGATVIDVGVNRIDKEGNRKIVGDVDFEDVLEVAGAVTTVPDGVGPMTVAYLMHNALKLTCCS